MKKRAREEEEEPLNFDFFPEIDDIASSLNVDGMINMDVNLDDKFFDEIEKFINDNFLNDRANSDESEEIRRIDRQAHINNGEIEDPGFQDLAQPVGGEIKDDPHAFPSNHMIHKPQVDSAFGGEKDIAGAFFNNNFSSENCLFTLGELTQFEDFIEHLLFSEMSNPTKGKSTGGSSSHEITQNCASLSGPATSGISGQVMPKAAAVTESEDPIEQLPNAGTKNPNNEFANDLQSSPSKDLTNQPQVSLALGGDLIVEKSKSNGASISSQMFGKSSLSLLQEYAELESSIAQQELVGTSNPSDFQLPNGASISSQMLGKSSLSLLQDYAALESSIAQQELVGTSNPGDFQLPSGASISSQMLGKSSLSLLQEYVEPESSISQQELVGTSNPGDFQLPRPIVGLPRTALALQKERTASMDLNALVEYFHLPLKKAAQKLSMCESALKNLCRRYELPRWPGREIRAIDREIERLEHDMASNNGRQSNQAISRKIEAAKLEKTNIYEDILVRAKHVHHVTGSGSTVGSEKRLDEKLESKPTLSELRRKTEKQSGLSRKTKECYDRSFTDAKFRKIYDDHEADLIERYGEGKSKHSESNNESGLQIAGRKNQGQIYGAITNENTGSRHGSTSRGSTPSSSHNYSEEEVRSILQRELATATSMIRQQLQQHMEQHMKQQMKQQVKHVASLLMNIRPLPPLPPVPVRPLFPLPNDDTVYIDVSSDNEDILSED